MPTEGGHRLYVKFVHPAQMTGLDRAMSRPGARHLGYRRNKHTTHPHRSLVKIEGVDNTEAASFYLGKKIAFIQKAPTETRGTHTRVIWGKVVRPHGNSGAVQARFSVPLPPKSFGASLRILLYPSSI
ncbi:putative 60S ribosomal protein L33-A [Rosellinia necatrix]|uniref:Putative 60S ribosomal protein L33-A n=1 Tax=Rosellinia necatrix TaxID=77044 RepID=A0A1W2TC07_ROSNE|nr:putative 60S ribosomal protein L33-A [Rosellinia necatrix]